MRLAIITRSRARVGGAETYLDAVLPALAARHVLAFASEVRGPSARGDIGLPEGTACWTVESDGLAAVVDGLRAWRPDAVYAHGLESPELERRVSALAPTVFFQHTFHGTCVSGSKSMQWPRARACERRLGAACLALFLPRRCGGLSPVTMARLYRTQRARAALFPAYAAVVTLSAYMRGEMIRHGVASDRAHVLPAFTTPTNGRARVPPRGEDRRLLFLGRLEPLKGVDRLLDALPAAAGLLGRRVRLDVAGEGASRPALEDRARNLMARDARVEICFRGWLRGDDRLRVFDEVDALVVPSLWPEPFGLVGIEAGAAGVPAVAFAAGGIPEWLVDGETGCLAPAAGASPSALAEAIVRCVRDREVSARYGAAAREAAGLRTLDRHVEALERVLDAVVQ